MCFIGHIYTYARMSRQSLLRFHLCVYKLLEFEIVQESLHQLMYILERRLPLFKSSAHELDPPIVFLFSTLCIFFFQTFHFLGVKPGQFNARPSETIEIDHQSSTYEFNFKNIHFAVESFLLNLEFCSVTEQLE